MADGGESSGQELMPSDEPPRADPKPALPDPQALMELERARIESADKKTALMEKAVDRIHEQQKRE